MKPFPVPQIFIRHSFFQLHFFHLGLSIRVISEISRKSEIFGFFLSLVKAPEDKNNELLHNKLVEEFGEDYEAQFDKPDKGFTSFVNVDGEQGGEWRIIRDINGIWHVPAYYGAEQSWTAKSINVDFWGAESGKFRIRLI